MNNQWLPDLIQKFIVRFLRDVLFLFMVNTLMAAMPRIVQLMRKVEFHPVKLTTSLFHAKKG